LKAYRIVRSPLTAVAATILTIVGIVVFRAGSLRTEHFFINQTPMTAQVAWYRKGGAETGSDRLLVAVNYSSRGWRGSRLRAMLAKTGETLGLTTDVPEFMEFSTELITAEIPAGGGSNLTAVAITHLPTVTNNPAAQLVAYEGNLYLLNWQGSNDGMDAEEDDERQSKVPNVDVQGWRLDQTKFVEITADEARSVSQSIERVRLRNPSPTRDSELRNQSSGWEVCTENVYSFRAAGKCPMGLGGNEFRLGFNRSIGTELDGPVFAQLVRSNNRETIRLTSDSNVWVESDVANYSSHRNKSVPAWDARSGVHFAGGWTNYLFGLLIALGFPYALFRTALNQSANSKPYFPEAKPEDFPGIDRPRLEEYTDVLTSNGFKHLRDYTAASSNPSRHRSPSFARLFVNPDLRCFAEVGQIFTTKKESAGMHLNFMTEFNGGWRFSTTDRVVNPVSYVARRARTLWLSRPGMAITEMLSLHCQMINQMKMRLSLTVLEDLSLEGYFLRSAEAVSELNKIIKGKSLWVFPLLLQYQYHKHKSHYEWLGNYDLKAPSHPWTPPAEDTSSAWEQTMTSWMPTINVASTVMLVFGAYLMFFRPNHSAGSSMFRMTISLLGLSGYGLVALMKKRSERR